KQTTKPRLTSRDQEREGCAPVALTLRLYSPGMSLIAGASSLGGLAAKQKPHRPGPAPALGLRARGRGLVIVPQTASPPPALPFGDTAGRGPRRSTMWVKKLWQRCPGGSARPRPRPPRRRGARLGLEQLEDRTVPSSFTAASVSDLIADINAANLAGGANTITLAAKNPFSLTAVNNSTLGPTGLPLIAANDNLTIVGNGDTIQRSAATGTPAFRLFGVASGAALALQNLTVQGGLENAGWGGGGIFTQGTLTLTGVTVQNNIAGGPSGGAEGIRGATYV